MVGHALQCARVGGELRQHRADRPAVGDAVADDGRRRAGSRSAASGLPGRSRRRCRCTGGVAVDRHQDLVGNEVAAHRFAATPVTGWAPWRASRAASVETPADRPVPHPAMLNPAAGRLSGGRGRLGREPARGFRKRSTISPGSSTASGSGIGQPSVSRPGLDSVGIGSPAGSSGVIRRHRLRLAGRTPARESSGCAARSESVGVAVALFGRQSGIADAPPSSTACPGTRFGAAVRLLALAFDGPAR